MTPSHSAFYKRRQSWIKLERKSQKTRSDRSISSDGESYRFGKDHPGPADLHHPALSHQGKRCKSYIIAEKILISTFVCTFWVSEDSPAKFKPPIALFKLMANCIAFNPTLAMVRHQPLRRRVRNNLSGDRILLAAPTPSEFSILFSIDPPLLTISIVSCDPRTHEQALDLFSGQLVFLAGGAISARYSSWRESCLAETLRKPIEKCAVLEGYTKHNSPNITPDSCLFSVHFDYSTSILITTKKGVEQNWGQVLLFDFFFPVQKSKRNAHSTILASCLNSGHFNNSNGNLQFRRPEELSSCTYYIYCYRKIESREKF